MIVHNPVSIHWWLRTLHSHISEHWVRELPALDDFPTSIRWLVNEYCLLGGCLMSIIGCPMSNRWFRNINLQRLSNRWHPNINPLMIWIFSSSLLVLWVQHSQYSSSMMMIFSFVCVIGPLLIFVTVHLVIVIPATQLLFCDQRMSNCAL